MTLHVFLPHTEVLQMVLCYFYDGDSVLLAKQLDKYQIALMTPVYCGAPLRHSCGSNPTAVTSCYASVCLILLFEAARHTTLWVTCFKEITLVSMRDRIPPSFTLHPVGEYLSSQVLPPPLQDLSFINIPRENSHEKRFPTHGFPFRHTPREGWEFRSSLLVVVME
jgi:hypothetical protein